MELFRAVPILTVTDLRQAVAGYQASLGLEIRMDHGWIVTLGSPDQRAEFSLMEADATAPVNPTASLEVADVDEAYRRVVATGLEIVHGPSDEDWGVRRFFFRDPGGNVINVLAHSTDARQAGPGS